jgi:Zn-dependent M28 family amino/carboxypeptidase
MSDLTITITIPEALAKTAEEYGLLTPEHFVALLEADVEQYVDAAGVPAEARERQRDIAIQRTRQLLVKLDALQPPLTESEIEQAINEARQKS